MPTKDDIIKQIKRYYLFYGPNNYKLDERIASLVKAIIVPGSEAFDLDRFGGKKCEAADVINAVSTPPVISPLRVVILSDADELSASGQTFLESFLFKIPDYSTLAMTAEKVDKRSKLFKRLSSEEKSPKVSNEMVHTYYYSPYEPSEALGLVSEFAAERNKEISPQVAGAVVEMFGLDPYRLENEVEKLGLYVGDKKSIEKIDLAFASGFDRVETPDELPGMILDGKIERALEFSRQAIGSGISEMQILFILRNYLIGLNLALQSKSLAQLVGQISKRPVLVRVKGNENYMAVARQKAEELFSRSKRISQEDVAKGLTYLFRAEYSLKSARFAGDGVVELLIMALYLTFNGNISSAKLYLI